MLGTFIRILSVSEILAGGAKAVLRILKGE
jgi:hypothetical protein